uniref:enhancer of split m7 protein-like n=1 Tax=Euleptes europaea TaxID=460621 RepID=UPI002540E419|nr:enhancer of split m7 protein-like [Euleptes europaea]
MSLRRAEREVLLTGTQEPRGHSWSGQQLEQPKRLVYKKHIKLLMEKRRRDRIVHCLNQLKTLLIDTPVQGHKPLPNSRMDKAAVLEMAVQRIQTLQQAAAEDKAFQTGYSYCASLVQAFLVSETRQQPEAFPRSDSASFSTRGTTPLATPPPPSEAERISCRSEDAPGSAGLRCLARSVPPSVLKKAGPQFFWRPWST